MNPLTSLLYYPIGWIYLWVRYRNRKKVKEVLIDKYDDQYNIAGGEIAMSIFGIVLIGILLFFLIVIIGRIIYDIF